MGECDHFRLGADGRVQCPVVSFVRQVSMIIGLFSSDEQQVGLYGNSQNFSTNKYIITADFSAVIVKSMVISDAGRYECFVISTTGGYTNRSTLSVYGKLP